MRKHSIVTIMTIILLFGFVGLAESKEINIIDPAGGESFCQGNQIDVVWESSDISGNLEIRLNYPGYSYRVVPSTPNDGFESFYIPEDYPCRCDWQVVITDYDEQVWDKSEVFCIVPPNECDECDLNEDGVFDKEDIIKFIVGCWTSSATWYCDQNGDGVLNVMDILAFYQLCD